MKICCICGQLFEGYGNNPAPIETRGECCDDCNINVVVPRRLLDAKKSANTGGGGRAYIDPVAMCGKRKIKRARRHGG